MSSILGESYSTQILRVRLQIRFRLLRMRLRDCWAAGKLKSVLVTSPCPGEGKSTTALNLATALAEERTRTVLLVDGDLHRGSLNNQLVLDPHVGLAECLQNRTESTFGHTAS